MTMTFGSPEANQQLNFDKTVRLLELEARRNKKQHGKHDYTIALNPNYETGMTKGNRYVTLHRLAEMGYWKVQTDDEDTIYFTVVTWLMTTDEDPLN